MGRKQLIILITLMLLSGALTTFGQTDNRNDYLIFFEDTISGKNGYKNQDGEIIIPAGKYSMCFTDTFRTYAIVAIHEKGFIAIDRRENMLYEVFFFDNGPDYPSEGLFRITKNNKIGFADEISGKVVIAPQFDCALPFENGVAQVSNDCETQSEGEYSTWVSNSWFSIDKSGEKAK